MFSNPLSLAIVCLASFATKGLTMIDRLKLLQSKYSLSNEFMVNAIRSEIERQALLDINGAINNCSIVKLCDLINSFTDIVVVSPLVTNPDVTESVPAKHAPKGKRRG